MKTDTTDNRPWLKQYDAGVPHQINYPLITVHEMLAESAKKYPRSTCTVFKGAKITYPEMDALTDRLAAALVSLGVQKGDRVGMMMPNIPQFVMAYFSILKAGGVVVAINPLFTAKEVEYQVKDAGIEIMFILTDFYPLIKEVQSRTNLCKLILTDIQETLSPDFSRILAPAKEQGTVHTQAAEGMWMMQDLILQHSRSQCPKLDLKPEDVALFQYSGGTTGISKAAIATHRNLVANALQIRSWLCNTEDGKETVLMAIPLYHVYGMVFGMIMGIYTGACLVMVPNARDLPDVLENIEKYKASIVPGVPTLYNAINHHPDVLAGKYDLSSIKACISGAAPLMRETKDKFEAITGGKLIEGYGLSEAPTATHINPLMGENRAGSIGLPLPDVEARIVNLEDGVSVLQPNEIGELVLRAPQVMKGYHHMAAETTDTLRNGWLYTGDIARMDDDGYFYIIDRKKELIKPGGFQVWPREVEEVIKTHPKVLDVGAAGVPDPTRGEMVKAWVVLKPGMTASEDEIREYCSQELASFKVPTQVEFRTTLPKSTVGKLLRRELVRQHQESLEKG